MNVTESGAITFKEFQTDNLPCEQYHKVVGFLEEVINNTYDPKNLSDQTNGNLYRVKSKGRQDLRLLGFLNDNHNIDTSLLTEYIEAGSKNDVIRKLVLKQEYFQIALFVLNLLKVYPKAAKKATLVDLAMTIVRNSRGDNLMVESVAKERTHNLLMWFEQLEVINAEWIPSEQYIKKNEEKGGNMSSSLREGFLKIMKEYLDAKTEKFAGHKLGLTVRNDMATEIIRLPFINEKQYSVIGSVGKGNWATVPWIALMHRDITTSTQRGYYIVYLFSEDMQRLYLTIGQGVTETTKEEMQKLKKRFESKYKCHKR